MPSRNRSAKACDPATRSANETGLADFSGMTRLPLRSTILGLGQPWRDGNDRAEDMTCPATRRQSFRHGCRAMTPAPSRLARCAKMGQKKVAVAGGFKLTGRRQTEWTGATRCPEDGRAQ